MRSLNELIKDVRIGLWLKKLCLTFLIGTVIQISVNKSILMLAATGLYHTTDVPWFETWNYIFLALAVLILPILALFFLSSEHIRKALRLYFLIIIFFNAMELSGGIFSEFSALWLFDRPYNVIFVLVESFSAFICWLFLLRQFGGRSPLPIPIETEMYPAYTATEFWLMNMYRNLRDFLIKPVKKNKKLVNVVVIVNIILFSGLLITFIPENTTITLERPEDHEMRISFWGGELLDNSTLDIIGQHNGRLFVWGNFADEAKWSRFKDRNVSVLIVKGFEENESKWEQEMLKISQFMDILDSQPNSGVVGFVDDMEQLTRIIKYNASYYEKYVQFIQNKTNYVRSRGYEYHITQWLTAINDERDSDPDMGVVFNNPFDPVRFENLSSIGWMIYRSEIAIKYDEPYEYFSHHWASQVRNYMNYIEQKYNFPKGFWWNKTTVSIGVMGSQSIFTFNGDLNRNAKAQMINEFKMWHANRIPEVIVFYAGETNNEGVGTREFFKYLGGNNELLDLYQELENYTSVSFQYKRRATFFGNLKMLSNLPGSVFGLFYSDVLYNRNTPYLLILSLVIYIGSAVAVLRHPFSDRKEMIERDSFCRKSFILRAIFILELIGFSVAVYLIMRMPELINILGSIEYYLTIYL